MRAYFAMVLSGAAVHLFWPTIFPRAAFPVEASTITGQLFVLFRQYDLPTNCLPSMHVAGATFAALTLWKHPRWIQLIWSAWAVLIALSTLTTKQHYAIDVLAGVAMAAVFWAAFYWRPESAPSFIRSSAQSP